MSNRIRSGGVARAGWHSACPALPPRSMDVKRLLFWGSLLVSSLGLGASLIVHIRSFFGIGLFHWVVPFGLIFCLTIPYLVARSDLTGTLDYVRQSEAWGQAFLGRRPRWMNRMAWVLFAYFMVFFLILLMKDHANTFYPWDSGRGLPAPVAQFFSTGWMCFYWEHACTLWRALHLDSRHTTNSSSR